ncbi:MAG: hypothetical protein ACYCS1_08595 [Gammaproteobacteria bacterium]
MEFEYRYPHQAIDLLRKSGIVGAGVQADIYRCLMHGRIGTAELNPTLIPARARHFSAYPITTLTHLAILGLNGRCQYSHHRFLILLERAQSIRSRCTHNRFLISIYLGYENERLGHLTQALHALESAAVERLGSPLPWILRARWLLRGGQPARTRRRLERGRLRLDAAPTLASAWEVLARKLDGMETRR